VSDECIHGLAPLTCSICLDRTRPKPVATTRERSLYDGRKTPENSDSYFDHTWPEWFEMRDAGIAYVSELAREARKTRYGELWKEIRNRLGRDIGSHIYQLPMLLEYMSVDFFEDTGLILTALVEYAEGEEKPGDGFFRLAGALGAIPKDQVPEYGTEWVNMTPEQEAFWKSQVEKLFEYFRSDNL
jgi:hypothetical protein